MKHYYTTLLLLLSAVLLHACSKEMTVDEHQTPTTRAYGVKTPKIIGIVETNDTDPRNVLSYHLGESESDPCFFDIVEFFAANIHRDSNGDPSIYFNQELAPLMADTATYIKPIKDAGVKVVLSVLGDWQRIGVANLSESQADKLTDILVQIVRTYGLDGISIDDEYANYESVVSGSFARVIKQLRAKFEDMFPDEHKLIGIDQWGNYGQIDEEAGSMIDYVYHGGFGPNMFPTTSAISGVGNSQFAPQILNLGLSYNKIYLMQIKNRSRQAAAGAYGGITLFNLRVASEVDPLPVFQAIAEGAYQSNIIYDGTEYPQDWTFILGGHTITHADLPLVNPDPTPDPEPEPEPEPEPIPDFPAIPVLPDNKTPKIITYVDVGATNPLNMKSYSLEVDGNLYPFVDLCILNVAEIRKDNAGNPVVYMNSDLSNVLDRAETYIRPLQQAGTGVLLLVWGGHAGIGVANMTDTQADIFVDSLVQIVGRYGLNGITLNDEYADYSSILPQSWSNIIHRLREKFDTHFPNEHRLITVQQWGNYNQINADAGSIIDYADHGTIGTNVFMSSSSISGVTNDRWAPQAIYMGQWYNVISQNQIKVRSSQAKSGGYGAIMMEDVRAMSDVDPLPVFSKIAEGAFGGTVTHNGTVYSRDWK